MSSVLHTLRYPSGAVEYRWCERAPSVGEPIARGPGAWVVESVASNADGSFEVTLAPGPTATEDAGQWPMLSELDLGVCVSDHGSVRMR